MNLHAITPPIFHAAIAMFPVGANGHRLSRAAHLWLVERGTPPPLGEERPPWARVNTWWRPARYWWNPFSQSLNFWHDEEVLTPFCGRLKSRSTRPHLQLAYDGAYICDDCKDVAKARGYKYGHHRTILREDPWYTIPLDDRGTTPDPLTGE